MKADSIKIIHYLLKRGSEPNLADNEGNTPMHLATERDMLNVVQLMIGTRGGDPEQQNMQGYSCLHIAARLGFLNIAKCLRTYSVEIEHLRDNEQFTASHWANHNGHAEVAAVLPEPKEKTKEEYYAYI